MKFEDLTNEQIEKAKACTTKEEKIAFPEEYSIDILRDFSIRMNYNNLDK